MLVAVSVLLVLADQSQVAVVDHHDHDRYLVLPGHGQLFAHEQEAGIAHHDHRRIVGASHLGADGRRHLVAERARAAGRQVAPGQFDVLQLARPDLGDAAAGGEHGVRREELVDLLEYTLRLDGYVFVIGLARHLLAGTAGRFLHRSEGAGL